MFCSYCGRALQPEAQFCGGCGHAVAASAATGLNELLQGFVSVSLKEVVLLDKMTGSEILKSPVFRFLCLFALTPLAIEILGSYGSILNGLAIWSGVLWALLLFRLFADRDLPFGWAVGMLLFTFFIMLPIFEVYIALPPQITEWAIEVDFLPIRFLGFVFGVGVREEMCKAMPLILLAFMSTRVRNPLNGLVLGMMSGVGFAASENVYYVIVTLKSAIAETQKTGDFSSFVVPVFNNVVRMMTGPFGHGCYSGIFGYFISLAAADRPRRVPLFLAGLGVSSLLHGVYDTFVGVSPLLGVLIKAFNFFLLMTYILKARGLTSARELAGGMFQRTIIGRPPPGLAAAASAAAASAAAAAARARAAAAPALSVEATAPAIPRSAAAVPPAPSAAPMPPVPPPRPPAPEPPTLELPATAALRWRLRGVAGPVSGRAFDLEGEVRIGRDAAKCAIHLSEPIVSRQHALVVRDERGAGWRLRRLSTTGPVYVNGQAVEDVLLKPADQLQIGAAVFLVETE